MSTSQKTVLITGILGQDGTYLAEHALKQGHRVIGGIRGELADERVWRLRHMGIDKDVTFTTLDLTMPESIDRAFDQHAPDLVFNFAAQSSVGDSFNRPIETAEAGGIGAIRIFEQARQSGQRTRVFQASSSEIFGDITDSHHSEESFFNPKTPYGATKLFAHIMAEAYRASYGTHVSTGILFNHESPLRGINFVTRKITHSLARVHLGLQDRVMLGNLDARRDWSHARDFVHAIWRILELDQPDNFVLASGRLTSVREFVNLAAQALDMDIVWEGSGLDEVGINRVNGQVVIAVDPSFYRPYDPTQPLADIRKAQRLLNWQPRHDLSGLIQEMVAFDLDLVASRHD